MNIDIVIRASKIFLQYFHLGQIVCLETVLMPLILQAVVLVFDLKV